MKFIETIKFIKKQFDTNKFIPLHEPVFIGKEKEYLQLSVLSLEFHSPQERRCLLYKI